MSGVGVSVGFDVARPADQAARFPDEVLPLTTTEVSVSHKGDQS